MKIAPLLQSIPSRVADAAVSMLRPANKSVRTLLQRNLSAPPGSTDGITADPAFEAMFGWEQGAQTLDELAAEGLLDSKFVNALAHPPTRYAQDYTFPGTRRPFSHQLAAWRAVLQERKSVLVSSGTGSGKTESFLFPILSELTRELGPRPSEGVRALFIYPLNALIRSQRERLTAWMEPSAGRLRFCLYNRQLEKRLEPHKKDQLSVAEVPDRTTLWASPPPVLVTNTTMLEYMLVRHVDAPILHASQGKLRWIVIDEAHSYMGTQAAELALQLRRTMEAFGVTPNDVQIIATSATIGDDSSESDAQLQRFMADLSGVSPNRVVVVRGRRHVPSLKSYVVSDADDLEELEGVQDAGDLFNRLVRSRHARSLRDFLARTPGSLADIANHLGVEREKAARWVDIASTGIAAEGTLPQGHDARFLPLRTHLMQQTVEGGWACINRQCAGRIPQRLDQEWAFGAVFFKQRILCQFCESKVFPLQLCVECGCESLDAVGVARDGQMLLTSRTDLEDEYLCDVDSDQAVDDGVVEAGTGEMNDDVAQGRTPYLLLQQRYDLPEDVVETMLVDAITGEAYAETSQTELLAAEPSSLTECPACGGIWRAERSRREVRVSGPFTLGTVIPELLRAAPADPDVGRGADVLMGGRRLLAFTDSRQGTARGAVRLADRSMRDFIRSAVPHTLAAARHGLPPEKRSELERRRKRKEQALPTVECEERLDLESELAEINAALSQPTSTGCMTWREMVDRLKARSEFRHIAHYYLEVANQFGDEGAAADLLLLRELYRRPKRQNSLETLGLVELRYPKVVAANAPGSWRQLGGDDSSWRDFLVIVLNAFIRENAAVIISDAEADWLGTTIRAKRLYRHKDDVPSGAGDWGPQTRGLIWPAALRAGMSPRHRLHRIIFAAYHLDPTDSDVLASVNSVMDDAFRALTGGLSPVLCLDGRGYCLDLKLQELAEPAMRWLCPVTHRLLSTTLMGVTPYLHGLDGEFSRATPVDFPAIPHAHWQQGNDIWPEDKRKEWLEEQSTIANLKAEGIWNDALDLAYLGAELFMVREHSAQIDSATLGRITDQFKEGRLNVLSCSTTMEMGVDIGGLSIVAMTNPPPLAANYLQRAGRAGRRGETRALAYTLCRPEPRAQALFDAPGAYLSQVTRVPAVSLESALIVQRHVNAWLLGYFLNLPATPRGEKLTTGFLFGASDNMLPSDVVSALESSQATRLIDLLRTQVPEQRVRSALSTIVRGSSLASNATEDLLQSCAHALEQTARAWWEEYQPLLEERHVVGDEAAAKAISHRLTYLRGEKLLAHLSMKGFLPTRGFPTHVRELVLPSANRAQRQRDDATRNTALNRPLPIALREYQPGVDVIVDGARYEVGGVTLNWQRPASEDDGRSPQNFRWFARCGRCGHASEESYRPTACRGCGEESALQQTEYLEPAGFAVAQEYRPNGDISMPKYRPVEPPVFALSSPWARLPQGLGRVRAASDSEIFYMARGAHRAGFEICLQCGRTASAHGDDSGPALNPRHLRLRGGGYCEAEERPWSIKRVGALGGRELTDVLELQLVDISGLPLSDKALAISVAVLLRNAAAAHLRIEPDELGFATQYTLHGERSGLSIILFDRASGGAGYVTKVVDEIPHLMQSVAKLADCTRKCERACTYCMLSHDAKDVADDLDRKKVLAMLTPDVINRFALQEGAKVFGPYTVAEISPVAQALGRMLASSGGGGLMRFFVGAGQGWDSQSWSARQVLLQNAANTRAPAEVRIAITSAPDKLDAEARDDLATWLDAGLIHAVEVVSDVRGKGRPLVEFQKDDVYSSWAITGAPESADIPNSCWATGGVVVRGAAPMPTLVAPLNDSFLQRTVAGGNAGNISVGSHGAFPARKFGDWLASELEKSFPGIKDRLRSRPNRVEYSDRYFRSYDSPAVLAAFVQMVVPAGESIVPIDIRAARLESGYDRRSNNRDFSHEDARKRALLDAFKTRADLKASSDVRDKMQMDHARLLTAHYDDGSKLVFHLDQGVDFWACDPPLGLDGRIRPRFPKHKTKITAWIE